MTFSKIVELEEELRIVGNNMKSLEVSEQEVMVQLVAGVTRSKNTYSWFGILGPYRISHRHRITRYV